MEKVVLSKAEKDLVVLKSLIKRYKITGLIFKKYDVGTVFIKDLKNGGDLKIYEEE